MINRLHTLDTIKESCKEMGRGKMNTLLFALLSLGAVSSQAQTVSFKPNVATMAGRNMETKEPMLGLNAELISLGYEDRRMGVGINPAVYLDEKKSGKLGPSVQLTKTFDGGEELRAILGTHGEDVFVGVGGKITFGKKSQNKPKKI